MLQKQVAQIDFTGGVSKKAPDELVIPTKLAVLDNAVFDANGNLNARAGYVRETITAMSGSSTPTAPNRVTSHKATLLLEDLTAGAFRVHTLGVQSLRMDPTLANVDVDSFRTNYRGSVSQVWAGGTASAGVNYNTTDFSFVLAGGYRVYAWMDSTVRYRIEAADGAVIAEGAIYDVTGLSGYSKPRVVYNAANAAVYLYYVRYSGGAYTLRVRKIPTSTFVLAAEAQVGALSASVIYDVHSAAVITAAWVDGGMLRQKILGTDGATAAYSNDNAVAGVSYLAVHSTDALNNRVYAVWHAGGTAIWGTRMNHNGANPSFPIDFGTAQGVGSAVNKITLTSDPGTGEVHVVYDNTFSGAYPATGDAVQLRFVTTDDNFGTIKEANICGGYCLQGRLLLANGRFLLPVWFRSTTTPGFFLIDITWHLGRTASSVYVPPHVVARLAWGEAHDGQGAVSPLPEPQVPAAHRVEHVFTRWSPAFDLVAGANVTTRRIVRASFDFRDQTLGSAEVQDLLYLAGACPQVYDGARIVEEGFNTPPIVRSAAWSGTGGYSGSFQVVAVFEHIDQQGNKWQSLPSAPVTAVASSHLTLDIVVATLRSTMRPGVRIVIYRTTAGGSIFYRDLDLANNTSVAAVGIAYSSPAVDAVLATGSQVPTAGGRLENIPMPPCRNLAVHQRRLWAAGGMDDYEFWYSDQPDAKFAPAFNDTLRHSIPQEWGRLVGLAPIDDKIAFFGEAVVGVVYGEGPTPAGALNGYSSPTPILQSAGTKWAAPNAIAASDVGVWFQTETGIRLLSRGLATAATEEGEVGAEVDAYVTGANVAGVVQPADEQRVYFYLSTGVVVVYDSYFKQWSRFTNIGGGYGATLANIPGGTTLAQYFVDGSAYLHRGYTGTVDPGSVAIVPTVETAWFKFAGVQGFQRIRDAGLLATGTVSVYFGVDYATGYGAVHTLAMGATITNGRFPAAVQKCGAMRVKVTGFSTIRSLALTVGVKQGMVKLASTKYA